MTDLQSDESGSERGEDVAELALPSSVVERVESRVRATDFDSSSEYVAFVLRETLARVESESDDASEAVTEAEVESRLESLGYLE